MDNNMDIHGAIAQSVALSGRLPRKEAFHFLRSLKLPRVSRFIR